MPSHTQWRIPRLLLDATVQQHRLTTSLGQRQCIKARPERCHAGQLYRQFSSTRCFSTDAIKAQDHDRPNGVRDAKFDSVSKSTALPSHGESQRWTASKRWSALMDSVLARASVAGQHINVYTGTDYSGIEALRKEILVREEDVRKQHGTVADAKETHVAARRKQAESQKEIVGLLERKSSWSPADLERYMSLVRSEHVDDVAVQKAAEELSMSERRLEADRALLEKLERQQYHEEQIWSDTIRRNSTWVTIGLMGINIVLLLAQISIFEPYRRRKIVDQIEQALDHRMARPVVSEGGIAMEAINETTVAEQPPLTPTEGSTASPVQTPPGVEVIMPIGPTDLLLEIGAETADADLWTQAKSTASNLLGERPVQMPQRALTALLLQSAAAGMGVAVLCSLAILKLG